MTTIERIRKHRLLAWYGITDLRGAHGFEELHEPVLGAVKTRRYTGGIVPAYTTATSAPQPSDNRNP